MEYNVQQSSPGIQNIMDAVKSGQAKLVTAYPVAGSWNNAGAYSKYSDTPSMTFEDEYGQVSHGESQNLLYMNGKLYLPNNDWSVIPVTKSVQVGGEVGDGGFMQPIFAEVPTGQFRIRQRADGNVFNDFYIAADGSGKITNYSPTLSQSGSNSGWGGGMLGNFLSDVVNLAKESAPVWGAALGANALGGALGAAGAGAAETAATVLPEAGFGEISAADLANLGYDSSWANSLGATGLEPVVPDGVTVNPVTPPSTITPTELPPVEAATPTPEPIPATEVSPTPEAVPETVTTTPSTPTELPSVSTPNVPSVPAETPPNLEGGDLGMTETQAQEQFYKDIGIDPTTLKDLPPATTAEINQIINGSNGITASDISKIKNIVSTANTAKNLLGATGLLGGTAGALGGAAAALAGVAGANALLNKPSTYTPPSQAGTSSGVAAYSPEYYQQIQQNYNRLFPTAPADIATPLQSWYATKFVPDTNISQKLFGV
jgi:hypothetical protein